MEMSSSRFVGRWKSYLLVSLELAGKLSLEGRGEMRLVRWWGECEGSWNGYLDKFFNDSFFSNNGIITPLNTT